VCAEAAREVGEERGEREGPGGCSPLHPTPSSALRAQFNPMKFLTEGCLIKYEEVIFQQSIGRGSTGEVFKGPHRAHGAPTH